MELFVWMSVMASKKSIHIESPYLLPSKAIREALESKARKGIDVKIIVPGDKTNTPYTRWASHSFYAGMIESGIHIYEYQPSMMHAKTMTMDDKWSIVGSANLDNRSSRINLELILGIDDVSFAKDMEEKFSTDIGNAKEVTKEDAQKYSTLLFPLEWGSRLFIQQY